MVLFSILFACKSEKEQGYDYLFETNLSSEESQENADSDSDVEEPEDVVDEPVDVVEEGEPEPSEPNPDGSATGDSEICGSLVEGAGIGDCAQNFSLTDIDQEMVSLHDFHGQVIFLDLSSFT